jgi:hypothetical protein
MYETHITVVASPTYLSRVTLVWGVLEKTLPLSLGVNVPYDLCYLRHEECVGYLVVETITHSQCLYLAIF